MDPLLAAAGQSLWLSIGGWGVSILFGLWMVTGFTVRGWTTAKQREELRAGDKATIEEQKTTIATQQGLNAAQATTILKQASTIATIDQFFGKLPVKTPNMGGTLTSSGAGATETETVI